MKKTILTLAVLASLAVSSYGQGTVIFATTASAGTRFSTNAVVGGPSAGQGSIGSSYYFALFYSTSGATTVGGSSASVVGTNGTYAFNDAAGNWSFVAYGTNSAAGGKMAAFGTSQNTDGSTTIPTIAAAGTAELVAIGWSASIGSTWQSLQTYLAGGSGIGWVGESAVASITLGNAPGTSGSQTPVSMFGTGAGQVGGVLLGEVIPTPEPGTLALAALGGASLLMFRRKNK